MRQVTFAKTTFIQNMAKSVGIAKPLTQAFVVVVLLFGFLFVCYLLVFPVKVLGKQPPQVFYQSRDTTPAQKKNSAEQIKALFAT